MRSNYVDEQTCLMLCSALSEYSNQRSDDDGDRRFQKRKNASGLRRKRIKIKKLVPKQAR